MSILLRFLGLENGPDDPGGESPSIGKIAAELGALEPEQARFFATFAYVLARVAGADLRFEASELNEMKRILVEIAGIGEPEAELVAEIATHQVRELGATHNFLVTRTFKEISSHADRVRMLHCLFAVAAADEVITGDESTEVLGIAQELGLSRQEALGIRTGFRQNLAELRKLPGET